MPHNLPTKALGSRLKTRSSDALGEISHKMGLESVKGTGTVSPPDTETWDKEVWKLAGLPKFVK
jgi:hypothetical protein